MTLQLNSAMLERLKALDKVAKRVLGPECRNTSGTVVPTPT
jgi:hypothetical protein